MRRMLEIFLCSLLILWACPLDAYTIFLKDGSTIIAEKKYEIRDGNAIITFPGGTETSFPISEIDVQRTEEGNRTDYGSVKVVEGGIGGDTSPEFPIERKQTLSDLAATRGRIPRLQREQRDRTDDPGEGDQPTTMAGYVDLTRVRRTPLDDLDLASEVSHYFRRQGVESLALFRGTQSGRLLLDITANSEAAVFRALEVSASALLHLREAYSDAVEAFELTMATHRKQRAGQFLIDQERATSLASKQIDLPHFYLKYVEF